MIAFFGIVLVGFILSKLYPWIHQSFFNTLPEAEVQTYALGVAIGTMFLSLWFWFAPWRERIRPPPNRLLLFITLFVGIGTLFLFQQAITQNQELITFFQDMEVFLALFSPIIYVLVTAILFILFKRRFVLPGLVSTVIAILIITLLTFHVGYLNPYDFGLYAGPINDALGGMGPLSYPSYYGFFVIIFLSKIFTIIPLSLFHLHLVTAIGTTLGFIAFYALANLLLKNRGLAFLATLLAISANWLTGIGYRGSFPQAGILRFGMWYLVAFAIYGEVRFRKLTPFIVTLSFFWSFDVGSYIVAAYLMFRWFMSLDTSPKKTITAFIPHLIEIFGLITLVFLLISLSVHANWDYFWGSTNSFLSGPFLLPLTTSIIPWLMFAPCVIVICYELKAKKERNKLLLFISCYGVMQFMYFVSRSHPNNLHHIVLPSVLCLFFLFQRLIKNGPTGMLAASLLLAYPMTMLGTQAVQNLQKENIFTTLQTIRRPSGTEEERFGQTAKLLQEHYGAFLSSGDFGLLSFYDTWYMILLNRPNTIGTNALITHLTPAAALPIVENIQSQPPTVLFVDKNPYDHLGEVSWVFDKISYLYERKESLGLLDIYGIRR